jgi:hypothetical protein
MEVLGIEPGTSGSVARNSDHYTTDAPIGRQKDNVAIKFIKHVKKKKGGSSNGVEILEHGN